MRWAQPLGDGQTYAALDAPATPERVLLLAVERLRREAKAVGGA